MPILGLMTTEQAASYRPKNVRRSVFYMYPNGTSPLIGLLTMMKDEVTNDPEFKWWEKRMLEQSTTTAYESTTVTFGDVDSSFNVTVWVANTTFVLGTSYSVKVASTAQFRVGQIIKFLVTTATPDSQEVQGVITYVDATNARLIFRAIRVPTAATDFDAAITGNEVLAIGAAQREGGSSDTSAIPLSTLEVYNAPIGITNFTQIFTANWKITGTAGKTAVWFDTRGVDPDLAKEAAVNNSRYMEYSFIFGTKREEVIAATTTTEARVTRFTGGILYWLTLWEAGATYGNTAATTDTQDGKRIIENTSGTITRKQYNKYLERHFRFNRNKQNESICLCGNGFLNTLNEMYAGSKMFTATTPDKSTFGMAVTAHTTPFGTVYYKTHPLFNLNSTLMYNGLFIDIPCLKYRPMAGRDTTLRKNLQLPGEDAVEDGWLTEAGMETASPESHMYMKNVQDYTA